MLRFCRILASALILCVLMGASPASAHALRLRTEPPDGVILATAPTVVRIWFSEPIVPFADGISVFGPSGRKIVQGKAQVDGAEMHMQVAAAEEGTYVVQWRVISDDTHPTRGSFAFSVGHASAAATETTSGEIGSVSPLGLALQVGAHWLHFLGFALGFGVLAFQVGVLETWQVSENLRGLRVWSLVNIGVVLLIVAEPVALLAQTASLSPSEMLDPATVSDALDSSFGRALALRLGAGVLLWVLVGIAKDGSPSAVPVALASGWLLALLDGASAHAASIQPAWLGLTLNALHLAAVGVWVGGLIALLAQTAQVSENLRGLLVRRFSFVAVTALAIISVTGIVMAWLHLAAPGNLIANVYGIVLSVKFIVALIALLPAAFAMRAVQRRPERWWLLEAAALVGVLALAGLLVSLPPPA